jgi:peroxiredoxin Q/BCP
MIAEGEQAPDFELRNQDDEPVRLSSFRGRPVVVYFYPAAMTPGCTVQACAIRDRYEDFEAAGAAVLGVSPDKPSRLAKFAGKYDLPFTLLSDPDHEVARQFGAWGEKRGPIPQLVTQRSTFVIDADGVVTAVMPKVNPRGHDQLVLEALGADAPATA